MLVKFIRVKKKVKCVFDQKHIRFFSTTTKKGRFGSVYIKCTKGNIFCTLIDTLSKKVITSCSLRVPAYVNEYNERENLYMRGLLLGKLFSEKIIFSGYNRIIIYLSGASKGRFGVIRSIGKTGIRVYAMLSDTCHPHNGCRPSKTRRKKFRSRAKSTI